MISPTVPAIEGQPPGPASNHAAGGPPTGRTASEAAADPFAEPPSLPAALPPAEGGPADDWDPFGPVPSQAGRDTATPPPAPLAKAGADAAALPPFFEPTSQAGPDQPPAPSPHALAAAFTAALWAAHAGQDAAPADAGHAGSLLPPVPQQPSSEFCARFGLAFLQRCGALPQPAEPAGRLPQAGPAGA